MKMATPAKLGLAALFLIVTVIMLFDILRTAYSVNAYLLTFPDLLVIWSLCEPSAAVIVCALPIYKGILPLCLGKPKSSKYPSSYRMISSAESRRAIARAYRTHTPGDGKFERRELESWGIGRVEDWRLETS